MSNKKYVVVLQCEIVKERCSGYYCEHAFTKRTGKFDGYPDDKDIRYLPINCGGCCGKASHRKLSSLIKQIKNKEKIEKEQIVVHLSSCIALDSYHGPPCPHLDYLKAIVGDKLKLDLIEGTKITELSEKRRHKGIYHSA